MKTLKTKRIFVLIWVVLALSALASIIRLTMGIMMYSTNSSNSLLNIPFWLAFFKLFTTGILLMMSLSLWKIAKAYTKNNIWQPKYYQKVRQLGYLAIVLTIIYPSFQVGLEAFFFSPCCQFINN